MKASRQLLLHSKSLSQRGVIRRERGKSWTRTAKPAYSNLTHTAKAGQAGNKHRNKEIYHNSTVIDLNTVLNP